MDMGGHGLYSTVGEYMKFIRMLLNDGAGANGRVLRPETVASMTRSGLPSGLRSGGWTTSIASLSNDGEYFPTVPKNWVTPFRSTRKRRLPADRPVH